MKKQGRFLSNTFDPKHPDARKHFKYSYHARCNGPSAVEREWECHMAWINENIIGPPKATKKYTQKQLEDMNLVGVYVEEGK